MLFLVSLQQLVHWVLLVAKGLTVRSCMPGVMNVQQRQMCCIRTSLSVNGALRIDSSQMSLICGSHQHTQLRLHVLTRLVSFTLTCLICLKHVQGEIGTWCGPTAGAAMCHSVLCVT